MEAKQYAKKAVEGIEGLGLRVEGLTDLMQQLLSESKG